MMITTITTKRMLGVVGLSVLMGCGAKAPDSLVNLPDKEKLVDASQTSDEEFRAALANYEAGKDRANALKAVEYRNGEPVYFGKTKMQFNPIAQQVSIHWDHKLVESDTVSSATTIYPTDPHGQILQFVDQKTGQAVPLAPIMKAAFQGQTMQAVHVRGIYGILKAGSYGLGAAMAHDNSGGGGAVAIASGVAQQSQESSTKTKVESKSGSDCKAPCGF